MTLFCCDDLCNIQDDSVAREITIKAVIVTKVKKLNNSHTNH